VIQVVFAGLIDHANLAELSSGFISDNSVKLSKLKRCGIALVLDTDDKSRFGFSSIRSA
jgi:hypothetical protein